MGFRVNTALDITGLNRPFGGGHFLFTLDGTVDPGYVRSVEGGLPKGTVVSETVGPDYTHFKHLSTVDIEPLTLELGMSMSLPMLNWIKKSWKRKFTRRNGAVLHADDHYLSRLEQSFHDALITETTFPALDGAGNEPAYMTVKLQPERAALARGNGRPIMGVVNPFQKMWTPAMFRLRIDGIDTTHVNKVESFSVTQKIKQLHIGSSRFPELEPTAIEFGNLTIYTSMASSADLIRWYDAYVVKGDKDLRQERQGAIEFLSPNGDMTLFTVVLNNIGIYALSPEKTEANADKIKRIKAELYVETMDLDPRPGLSRPY